MASWIAEKCILHISELRVWWHFLRQPLISSYHHLFQRQACWSHPTAPISAQHRIHCEPTILLNARLAAMGCWTELPRNRFLGGGDMGLLARWPETLRAHPLPPCAPFITYFRPHRPLRLGRISDADELRLFFFFLCSYFVFTHPPTTFSVLDVRRTARNELGDLHVYHTSHHTPYLV